MRRSWFGLGLLLVLLGLSLLVTWGMTAVHAPVEGQLHRAEAAAVEENWEQARAAASQAEAGWNKWRGFRGCFADHTPVEEIDGDFELLKVYCAAREGASFAGGCLQLARQVAAVGEAHELVWWNLL